MKNIQKISFSAFMTGSYKREKPTNLNLFRDKYKFYSFISPTVFFDGGTILLLGVGVVAAGLAVLEQLALKDGDTAKADLISLLGNVLLQGGAIALALYLFATMPLLHWL